MLPSFVVSSRTSFGARALPALLVGKLQHTPSFSVAITGDHTVGNDFNTLSQRDLEHGELAFGLPAALLVLMLVFGAVVAGLVPVFLALLSILVGLGLVALLTLEFSLSEEAIVAEAMANQTDGYRMVTAFVRRRLGVPVNRKRVLRVMRERKLIQRRRPLQRRKRPGFFRVGRPRQLWQLDMSSVWVAETAGRI
jgi:hypothetical protein